MKYLIDTSSLIDINYWYDMNTNEFKFVWDLMDKMVKNDLLNTVIVVQDEIKDKSIKKWCKKNKNFFVLPNEVVQKEVSAILSKYTNLIKMKSKENSDADVFLIALAKVEDLCIVTSERITNSEKQNIPNTCKEEGIKCIDTRHFIYEILNNRYNY